MLSQTANHALRALLYMARQGAGTVVTAKEMAGATGAPPRYLAKTLQVLATAGLVRGTRGRVGGYTLVVPAESITVGDVMRAFETTDETPDRCLLGDRSCSPSAPCVAHVRWVTARRRAAEALSGIRILELVNGVVLLDESDDTRLEAAS